MLLLFVVGLILLSIRFDVSVHEAIMNNNNAILRTTFLIPFILIASGLCV